MYYGELDTAFEAAAPLFIPVTAAQWCIKPTSMPDLWHMLLHCADHIASATVAHFVLLHCFSGSDDSLQEIPISGP